VEVVAAAAVGEVDGEHLPLGVIGAGGQLPLLGLPGSFAEQLHGLAVAGEPLHPHLRPLVALRIAQERAERSVRTLPEQEVEGEDIVEGDDLAAPPVRCTAAQPDRRGVVEVHPFRIGGEPVADDGLVLLQPAAKGSLMVGKLEEQLAAFEPDGKGPAVDVGGERRSAALDDQRPADIGTEAALGLPEAE
jgi:hypothetical protein